MQVILWFIIGLALAAAISLGAVHLYRVKMEKEHPLPPENLPKDWDSVMPREKKRAAPKSQSGPPSFMRVGGKSGKLGAGKSKGFR